jgi:hypothetical protein
MSVSKETDELPLERVDEASGDISAQIAISETLVAIRQEIDGYEIAKKGAAVLCTAGAGRRSRKNKMPPLEPKLEALSSYRDQISAHADNMYAGEHDFNDRLIFDHPVESHVQANTDWDLHSDIMYDIADATGVTVVLRFMLGEELVVAAGYNPGHPVEYRTRDYAAMAALEAALEAAA